VKIFSKSNKTSKMRHPRRTPRHIGAGICILSSAALIAACSANATNASNASAATPATSITVWTSVFNNDNWQGSLLADFTKATGIKVNYQVYPESALEGAKLTVAQTAHSNAFTVFEDPESLTPSYISTQSVVPITSFLGSKTLTPSSYDASGIPASEVKQCTIGGAQYCEPVFLDGGPVLYYNKEMFAAAGIASPPQNWTQVEADAAKLTTPSHAGICMRGSESAPNGYPVLLMLPYFLPYSPSYQGEYLNADWKPLFTTPQGLTWAKEYATLMQKYAPKGVAAYSFTDCSNALNTGKVAMWWDDSALQASVLSPANSSLASEINVDEIPCPSFNQTCLLSAPWGFFINKNVSASQQAAGWKFIEYMTSPEAQLAAFKYKGDDPTVATRPATLDYILQNANKYGINKTLIEALDYGSKHIEPNAVPTSPAFAAIQNTLFAVLSQLITAQVTPGEAVSSLQSQMTSTLKTYGLPKSA
jgi:ABC-type glycerol-3-phosphate transport system substrate-binding protein